MVAIMRDAIGVGLAATQLGIMRRLLVFQAGPDAPATALVNPEIEWISEEMRDRRGGLPQPARGRRRRRAPAARAGVADGTSRVRLLLIEASGLEARVIQHEIDHLDGVLMLDRTEREQRKGALRALREGTSVQPRARAGGRAGGGDSTGRGVTRTVFLGTSEFAAAGAAPAGGLAASPGARRHAARRPRGRGRRLGSPPAADAARELGIELHQAADVNEPDDPLRADPRRRVPRSSWCAPSAS